MPTTAYQEQQAVLPGKQYGPKGACTIESFLNPVSQAEALQFGDAGFSYPGEKKVYAFKKDTAKLVFDGDFVTSNVITITVNSVAAADVTFDTDHDTTADAVVDAVAALDGVECVLDTDDTDNRTFLIRSKGATITVTEAITGGAGQVTGTVTTASGQVFIGYILRSNRLGGEYEAAADVDIIEIGKLYVNVAADIESNRPVYISADGVIGTATTGTLLPGRTRSNEVEDLAIIQVDGQKSLGYAERF